MSVFIRGGSPVVHNQVSFDRLEPNSCGETLSDGFPSKALAWGIGRGFSTITAGALADWHSMKNSIASLNSSQNFGIFSQLRNTLLRLLRRLHGG